jgi:hypothetical protein
VEEAVVAVVVAEAEEDAEGPQDHQPVIERKTLQMALQLLFR